MSESQEVPEAEGGSRSARSKIKGFWKGGISKGKEQLLKGKLQLQNSLGLGHQPNVIPPGEIDINGERRKVEIGWHPVAGLAGEWFAEKTGIGKMITEKIHKYPDPTQHWAVLVGDYCHELWMDEHLDVIYINEKITREEWNTFEVGTTRFNDEALRQAGEMVIFNMREKQPGYNVISNNCQNFATLMLDAIQVGLHREFATSFAVYQRAIGSGSITDLFVDKVPEEETEQKLPEETDQQPAEEETGQKPPKSQRLNIVQFAQSVMEKHTTKLDNHHSLF